MDAMIHAEGDLSIARRAHVRGRGARRPAWKIRGFRRNVCGLKTWGGKGMKGVSCITKRKKSV